MGRAWEQGYRDAVFSVSYNSCLYHFCRVMLKHRILLMNDGLDHNVIKIKPPLCFTKDNADAVLQAIDETLDELLN